MFTRRDFNFSILSFIPAPKYLNKLPLKTEKGSKIVYFLNNSIFSDAASAARLGRYCHQHISSKKKSKYQDSIQIASEPFFRKISIESVIEQKNKIENLIKDDFSSGSVVQIDGWFLSVTEVYLLALYYQMMSDTQTTY